MDLKRQTIVSSKMNYERAPFVVCRIRTKRLSTRKFRSTFLGPKATETLKVSDSKLSNLKPNDFECLWNVAGFQECIVGMYCWNSPKTV